MRDHLFYLGLAAYMSQRSKDPSTKTGAVIVGPDEAVISVGWNGFPSGMSDRAEFWSDREQKYSRVIHCTTPNHKTLRSDLRWVELGSLKVGDQVLAFEEYASQRSGRQYKLATVEAVVFAAEPVHRVTFSNNQEILATKEHLWLTGARSNNPRRWRATSKLSQRSRFPKHSTKIVKFLDVFSERRDYAAGWIAGLLDGEGTVSNNHGVSFAQRPGLVLDKALSILDQEFAKSYHLRLVTSPNSGGLGRHDALNVYLRGDLRHKLAFLGSVRAERLISRINLNQLGRAQGREILSVEEVVEVGVREIVKVQTSEGTLLVDGIPSHNCEVNALIFAGRAIPRHSTLYTYPFMSCDRCVVQMLQAGLRNFVAPLPTPEQLERWGTAFDRSRHYIYETGGALLELPWTRSSDG